MPWGCHTKATPARRRILVVDDEVSVRKVVRLTLMKAGYDVIDAVDGSTGISMIGSDDNTLILDVIVCDIWMPKMIGLEAITLFSEQSSWVTFRLITCF